MVTIVPILGFKREPLRVRANIQKSAWPKPAVSQCPPTVRAISDVVITEEQWAELLDETNRYVSHPLE